MRAIWKRLQWTGALLTIAAVSLAGAHAERGMNLGCYYRELGAKDAHLSPLERVVFTVLLAAKDQLGKHKRQA